MSTAAPIVVIAPDSLKGSCSSIEAARALAQGVRAALGPAADVREVPMADGGEGTLDVLVAAWHGQIVSVPTTDALGRPATGRIGFGTRTAIIEAADANGLPAVSDVPLRPLDADTAGVGELIRGALEAGADEILLCLGGSATNDGGAGLLRALGARLLGPDGAAVAPGARGLSEVLQIDVSDIDPRASRVSWRIACDVDNPLTGPRGAAAVFGPQKGATADDVAVIDAGLARFAAILAEASGADTDSLCRLPGLGAAGGLGLGLVALFGAQLVPGSELVSAAVGLREALSGASLVITGEGRFDEQSLDGKVVSRVLAEAAPGAPVVVIAGSIGLSAQAAQAAGVTAAFSIARGPAALEELQSDAQALLSDAAAQVAALFIARPSAC